MLWSDQVLDNIGFHWGRYTEYRMRPEQNRMSVALGVANPIFFMVEFDIQCIARNKASNIIIIMFLKSDLTRKRWLGCVCRPTSLVPTVTKIKSCVGRTWLPTSVIWWEIFVYNWAILSNSITIEMFAWTCVPTNWQSKQTFSCPFYSLMI